jgi:hypothetical protein
MAQSRLLLSFLLFRLQIKGGVTLQYFHHSTQIRRHPRDHRIEERDVLSSRLRGSEGELRAERRQLSNY